VRRDAPEIGGRFAFKTGAAISDQRDAVHRRARRRRRETRAGYQALGAFGFFRFALHEQRRDGLGLTLGVPVSVVAVHKRRAGMTSGIGLGAGQRLIRIARRLFAFELARGAMRGGRACSRAALRPSFAGSGARGAASRPSARGECEARGFGDAVRALAASASKPSNFSMVIFFFSSRSI
jgi:hypothetical protein